MDTFPSSPPAAVQADLERLRAAFVATGLRPAPELAGLPRTLFDDPGAEQSYDQIAWFVDAAGMQTLTPPLRYQGQGGYFDFRPALQGSLSNTQLGWRISDHFPLWASFAVRPNQLEEGAPDRLAKEDGVAVGRRVGGISWTIPQLGPHPMKPGSPPRYRTRRTPPWRLFVS